MVQIYNLIFTDGVRNLINDGQDLKKNKKETLLKIAPRVNWAPIHKWLI